MALEGLVLPGVPAQTPATQSTGPAASTEAATASGFNHLLAGLVLSGKAAPAAASAAPLPTDPLLTAPLTTEDGEVLSTEFSSDDDTTDDDSADGDLSDVLAQILLAANLPAQPAAAGNTASTSDGDSADSGSPIALVPAKVSDEQLASVIADLEVTDETAALTDVDGPQSTPLSALHASSAQHVTPRADSAQSATLHSTVGTPEWNDELATKLTWMAANGRESASLRLSPENLGPIEVRIDVQDGKSSVWFGAQQADTRAALEQALPRLREMFTAQGLSLADSGVFREAPRQQNPQSRLSVASGREQTGNEIQSVTSVATRGAGLLDVYA